uniref:Uncharacterized protein n=1 Tax=Oryza barthii TaxID=65489 RepID=A0A0D3H1J9_9ORYZ
MEAAEQGDIAAERAARAHGRRTGGSSGGGSGGGDRSHGGEETGDANLPSDGHVAEGGKGGRGWALGASCGLRASSRPWRRPSPTRWSSRPVLVKVDGGDEEEEVE